MCIACRWSSTAAERSVCVWFVRDCKVYDVTPFLDQHQGGASIIESLAGQNATDDFDSIHDDRWGAALTGSAEIDSTAKCACSIW
jgi:cytochrome b involved in lipid metabolism